MEGINPSPEGSIQLPLASRETGTPFSHEIIQLTKQAAIQLKWEAGYWKAQHDRLLVRSAEREHELKAQLDQLLAHNAELEQKLEHERAKNRDLKQRLHGKRSEKAASKSEAQPYLDKPSRPRGQTPGAPGHGRTPRPYLPVVEELRTLPPEAHTCPCCQKPYSPSGTEDSDIIEIEVRSYVRRIKRQRYRKTCQCPEVPGLVTAPPAPRLIPQGIQGISVWVEVLLRKYLYAIPTNRLCADLNNLGAPIAPGTLTGGLEQLMPLFEPLRAALLERHLTERLYHGDETGWKVFEAVEGKVGYRWYLWLTRSASVVYFWMAPGRGAKVLKEHFADLDPEAFIIFVCDRYKAYSCWAKGYPRVLLAFCWAHVRRDFLDGAKARPEWGAWMLAWVEAIGELYHLNDQRLDVWEADLPLAEQSPTFQRRHQALANRLADMAAERDRCLEDATLHSAQKKVLNSLKTHWPGLTVFVEHPQTPMDNNRAENSHRNPVTGRKNYYGSGAVWSAKLAAMLFSILQTIALWGINPRHWLQAFLTACAENGGQPPTELTPFLPWAMDEARLIQLKQPLPLTAPEARVCRPPDTS
jgi:transposase